MKDNISNLSVIAIIGIALVGLGVYIFSQDMTHRDRDYTATIDIDDNAYVLDQQPNLRDYSYTDKDAFEAAVESRLAALGQSLVRLDSEANSDEVKAQLEQQIATLRLQLSQARQASEEEWLQLRDEIAATYSHAQSNLDRFSH